MKRIKCTIIAEVTNNSANDFERVGFSITKVGTQYVLKIGDRSYFTPHKLDIKFDKEKK